MPQQESTSAARDPVVSLKQAVNIGFLEVFLVYIRLEVFF